MARYFISTLDFRNIRPFVTENIKSQQYFKQYIVNNFDKNELFLMLDSTLIKTKA